jgi:hypothetical protein
LRAQLNQRLTELRSEHEAGQKMLADLDAKKAGLTQTLLRIEGAMQVLMELLDRERMSPPENGATAGAPPPAGGSTP